MKRLTAITVLCVLFLSAFAAGKGPAGVPGYPDSLRSVWLYTEGIKQNAIARDTVRAREFFAEAIRNDSTFAPAYYEMAANGMYSTPDEAVDLARTAFRLDTANKWYHQFLGQALIYARRYDEALAGRLSRAVDWINIMSYDMCDGVWGRTPSHNTSLAVLRSKLAHWQIFDRRQLCRAGKLRFLLQGAAAGRDGRRAAERVRFLHYL